MIATRTGYKIEKLNATHRKKNFNSSSIQLDHYLRNQAGQDIKRNIAITYILTRDNSLEIIGYYSLSSISIDVSALPHEYLKKLPKYPRLPGILIGRLAVDLCYQGKKMGGHLLIDALKRCLLISDQLGANTVLVDAKDNNAMHFYLHYGFIPFPSNKQKLFLPMNTVRSLNL